MIKSPKYTKPFIVFDRVILPELEKSFASKSVSLIPHSVQHHAHSLELRVNEDVFSKAMISALSTMLPYCDKKTYIVFGAHPTSSELKLFLSMPGSVSGEPSSVFESGAEVIDIPNKDAHIPLNLNSFKLFATTNGLTPYAENLPVFGQPRFDIGFIAQNTAKDAQKFRYQPL